MKKYAFLFMLALPLCAQTNRFPPINTYPGDPTGVACIIANSLLQSTTTGGIYACAGGVYVNQGSASFPGVTSNGQGLNVAGNVKVGTKRIVGGSGEPFAAIASALTTCPASPAICVIDASGFTVTSAPTADLTIGQSNVSIRYPSGTITTTHSIIISPGVTNVKIECDAAWSATNGAGNNAGCQINYTGTGYAIQATGSTNGTTFTRYLELGKLFITTSGSALAAYYFGPQMEHVRLIQPHTNISGSAAVSVWAEANAASYSAFLDIYDPEFNGGLKGVVIHSTEGSAYAWGQSHIWGGRIMAAGKATAGTMCIDQQAGEISNVGTDVENCDIGLHIMNSSTIHPYLHADGCCVNISVQFDGAAAYSNYVVASGQPSRISEINGAKWNTVKQSGPQTYDETLFGGNINFNAFRDTAYHFQIGSGATSAQDTYLDFTDTGTGAQGTKWSIRKTNANQDFAIAHTATSATRLSFLAAGGVNMTMEGNGAFAYNFSNSQTGDFSWGCGNASYCAKVDGTTGAITSQGGFVTPASMRITNSADANAQMIIDSGSTAAWQSELIFKDRGTAMWDFYKATDNSQRLIDSVSSIYRAIYAPSTGDGRTTFNSEGTGYVALNMSTNSGTGGLVIGSGSATPTQVGLWDSSGNIYLGMNTSATKYAKFVPATTFTAARTINVPDANSSLAITKAGVSHNFLTAFDGATGLFAAAQPACADLSDCATLALLASPALTGTPTAPTAATIDNSTTIATTAFVKNVAGGPVASINLTAQTAAIGTTTFYTPAARGQYRVTFTLVLTTQGTAGTMQVLVGFSNGSAAGTTGCGGTTITTTAAVGTQQFGTCSFLQAASTNITYNVTFTGVTGSPAYSLIATVEKLQ